MLKPQPTVKDPGAQRATKLLCLQKECKIGEGLVVPEHRLCTLDKKLLQDS